MGEAGYRPKHGGSPARRMLRWMICTIAVALVVPSSTEAQAPPDSPSRWWLAFGIGAATGGGVGRDVPPVSAEFVYQRAPHDVRLRALCVCGSSSYDGGGGESRGVGEIGLLYGRTGVIPLGHVWISGGISAVNLSGCDRGMACSIVGVPITAGAAAKLGSVGIGLQGFLNLNSKTNYGGLLFSLLLGSIPR